MSTDPHDQILRRLRNVPVSTVAPGLDDLQQRVRRQRGRHARRRALTAGGVAVVLGTAGFASPHLPWLDGLSHPASAGATCGPLSVFDQPQAVGPAFWVEQERWDESPGLRAALRLLPDKTPSLVGLHDDGECPPDLPTAVLYDHVRGRGITIWSGVDAAADVGREPDAQHTTVGERPATVSTTVVGSHIIAWTTADGTPRYARANGMSVRELRETLAALGLTRTGIVDATIPTGYESARVPTAGQEPDTLRWIVEYDSQNQAGSAPDYSARLEITTEPHAPFESTLSYSSDETFLEIGGRTAVWNPRSDGGARLTWDVGEARYQLAVPDGTLKETVRMAHSLTSAADDDPRLVQAQGHGW